MWDIPIENEAVREHLAESLSEEFLRRWMDSAHQPTPGHVAQSAYHSYGHQRLLEGSCDEALGVLFEALDLPIEVPADGWASVLDTEPFLLPADTTIQPVLWAVESAQRLAEQNYHTEALEYLEQAIATCESVDTNPVQEALAHAKFVRAELQLKSGLFEAAAGSYLALIIHYDGRQEPWATNIPAWARFHYTKVVCRDRDDEARAKLWRGVSLHPLRDDETRAPSFTAALFGALTSLGAGDDAMFMTCARRFTELAPAMVHGPMAEPNVAEVRERIKFAFSLGITDEKLEDSLFFQLLIAFGYCDFEEEFISTEIQDFCPTSTGLSSNEVTIAVYEHPLFRFEDTYYLASAYDMLGFKFVREGRVGAATRSYLLALENFGCDDTLSDRAEVLDALIDLMSSDKVRHVALLTERLSKHTLAEADEDLARHWLKVLQKAGERITEDQNLAALPIVLDHLTSFAGTDVLGHAGTAGAQLLLDYALGLGTHFPTISDPERVRYQRACVDVALQWLRPARDDEEELVVATTLYQCLRWALDLANTELARGCAASTLQLIPRPNNPRAVGKILLMIELSFHDIESVDDRVALFEYAQRIGRDDDDWTSLLTLYHLVRARAFELLPTDPTEALSVAQTFYDALHDDTDRYRRHVKLRARNLLTTLYFAVEDDSAALKSALDGFTTLRHDEAPHLFALTIANLVTSLVRAGQPDAALEHLQADAVSLLALKDTTSLEWATIEAVRIEALVAAGEFDVRATDEVLDVVATLLGPSTTDHARVSALGRLAAVANSHQLDDLWGRLAGAVEEIEQSSAEGEA